MRVKPKDLTVGDLVEGYSDDGEDGVVGYGAKLNIPPPYQRKFVGIIRHGGGASWEST